MTPRSRSLLALLLLGLAGSPQAAVDPACRGKISGQVNGEFGCLVRLRPIDQEWAVFEILTEGKIEDVPGYQAGMFQVPEPVKAGRYTLDQLGMGLATVAGKQRVLFTAAKSSSQRGEVELTLTSVTADKGGGRVIHGTYRARLVPAGGGKTGEVVVEVTF